MKARRRRAPGPGRTARLGGRRSRAATAAPRSRRWPSPWPHREGGRESGEERGGMETGAGRPLRLVQGGKETGTNKVEKEEK